ncbi:MAG TPA: ATP-dependent DNA ligase [Candidatus Acidoferrales bacterium]|nr:ATP-dependent DNA ligase [Candidatus Acidoferrales bacterium]
MSLPLPKTYAPMEAQPAEELPEGPDWHYEPKWDGFRCIAFRDGEHVDLESKAGKPLTRYFPELVDSLKAVRAKQFVLDGEILIPIDGNPSFDDLLMRIHPAASRIAKLSRETPSVYIVFDLLVDENGKKLVAEPLRERRRALESFARKLAAKEDGIRLSPVTKDIAMARKWFHMGTGLDGIVAKRDDLPYQTGERTGMQKIKKQRTADCVVGGFRYLEKKPLVGSLLLGLYDGTGKLNHVGFTSSIHNEDRASLTKRLKSLIKPPGFTGKAPGGLSRWSTKRSMEWEPLDPKLVVEVQFDHFTGGRFRHGTKFLRWREDKKPSACTMEQVRRENKSALNLL